MLPDKKQMLSAVKSDLDYLGVFDDEQLIFDLDNWSVSDWVWRMSLRLTWMINVDEESRNRAMRGTIAFTGFLKKYIDVTTKSIVDKNAAESLTRIASSEFIKSITPKGLLQLGEGLIGVLYLKYATPYEISEMEIEAKAYEKDLSLDPSILAMVEEYYGKDSDEYKDADSFKIRFAEIQKLVSGESSKGSYALERLLRNFVSAKLPATDLIDSHIRKFIEFVEETGFETKTKAYTDFSEAVSAEFYEYLREARANINKFDADYPNFRASIPEYDINQLEKLLDMMEKELMNGEVEPDKMFAYVFTGVTLGQVSVNRIANCMIAYKKAIYDTIQGHPALDELSRIAKENR